MLLATFNSLSVRAEPSTGGWSKTYGRTGEDEAYTLVQTSDGGYALAGSTYPSGGGSSDAWLVKTDANGDAQWNNTYGGTAMDEAWALVQTSDGGYALAGETQSFGSGGGDFWLVKADSNGEMQWNKTYGGTGDDWAQALVQTGDGSYALAGGTASFGAGLGDFWLVKTDVNGNMQWNKTYGGNYNDVAYALAQTGDGGYALAGYSTSFGAGLGDFWLVKTDVSGNAQWNKTYGGTSTGWALALVQTSDGGYALAGETQSFGSGGGDFWLVKADSNGEMQWNKTYGGTSDDWAQALVQTGDGGYALAGTTGSFGAGDYDFWLVKTDALGNAQWNKTYGATSGDYGYALVQTADGGYALAGREDGDFWLVKTDANGVVPELPSSVILASFMVAATLTVILTKRKFRGSLAQQS
jgi:predicted secreted protein